MPNPITIPGLPAPPPPAVERAAAGEEEVTGEVLGEDGPVAGASVAFYLDTATQLRGPGYLEVATDAQGLAAAALLATSRVSCATAHGVHPDVFLEGTAWGSRRWGRGSSSASRGTRGSSRTTPAPSA